MVFFIIFSGELESIRLSLWNYADCGGWNVWLRVKQGTKSCRTKKIPSFSRGQELEWSGRQLRTCEGTKWNVNVLRMQIKIRSNHGNEFCPKVVRLGFNNTSFEKKIGDDTKLIWYSKFGHDGPTRNQPDFATRHMPIQMTNKIISGKWK